MRVLAYEKGEEMDYPYIDSHERLNKRELRRRRRRQAAWSLVHHKFDEVTDDEFDRAFKLLDRCIRYAIANDRFYETETEDNCNSHYRKHKEDLLWKRFQRLNGELSRYDARLTGNMYPQVVDINRHCDKVICLLYSEYAGD